MKLTAVVFLFVLNLAAGSKFHCRIMKVGCNASLKSITKPFCFLKAYRRNNPLLNVGFELKRVMSDGMVEE
jgi:hypothetical protein